MKKYILTLILFTATLHYAEAQFFFHYFDGEDTLVYNTMRILIDDDSSNIWQIGKPQKAIFDSAASFPNVIITDTINFYPNNNTSRFILKLPLNGMIWGVFALQWKQKLDFDPSNDGGIIEFTTDSGATWINVFNNPFVYNFYGFDSINADTLQDGQYAFSGTDSSWKDVWLCFSSSWISQFASNDTIMIRFTSKSDSINNNKEGWMIDNMLARLTFIHTIKEPDQKEYVNVFPNPSIGIVHVELQKLTEFHIIEKMELLDPMGQVIEQWTNIPTKFWFDTYKYPSGQYYLRVKSNIKSDTVPLMINKP